LVHTGAFGSGRARSTSGIQITLYPNPFVEGFFYQGPRSRYRVFNVLGLTVDEGWIENQGRVDLRAVPSGMYFVRLEDVRSAPVLKVRKLR
jgi:hypothetical protein